MAKNLRDIVPLKEAELPVHTNKGIGTLKHLAKSGPSKTMKFYISHSGEDASMYAGDSQAHTHHSLGAKGSQIWGAITHHADDDSYHFAANQRDKSGTTNTQFPADHHWTDKMSAHGLKRGKWNYNTDSVDKIGTPETEEHRRA